MLGTSLDPVYGYTASFVLGAIFFAGALDKLKQRELFAAVVEAYGLLPVPFVAIFALALGGAEFIVGCLLFLPPAWPVAQYLGLVLLGVVTVAVIINLLRGRTEISCGCGGSSADQELSWALVIRNGALGGLLASALLPMSARPLTAFDFTTIALATIIAFGLYAAGNQLLANAPRVALLRV